MPRQIASLATGTGPSTSAVNYTSLGALQNGWVSVESNTFSDSPVAGSIDNVAIRVQTAPGAGASYVIVVFKNGSTTPCEVTLSGTSTTALSTGTTTVVAGDVLSLRSSPSGNPAPMAQHSISWELVSTVVGESGYFGTNQGFASTNGAFQGVTAQQNVAWSTASAGMADVMPIDGTFTRSQARLGAGIGAGSAYIFTLYKNGTKQDGTGGTPNTTVRIAGPTTGSTNGNSTYSLSVVKGDLLFAECLLSSNPASVSASCGYAFSASTATESIFSGHDITVSPSTSGVNYIHVNQPSTWGINETLNNGAAYFGGSQFQVGQMYVNSRSSAGGNGSYEIALRINASNAGPIATLSSASTLVSDLVNTALFNAGDFAMMRSSAAGGPSTTRIAWAFGMTPGTASTFASSYPPQYASAKPCALRIVQGY